jgi:hypothetical protein
MPWPCTWRHVVAELALTLSGLAPAAHAADAQRGRALYEGRLPLATAMAPAVAARACVECHRPSGLGSFEGGLAVPPINGPTLFKAFDRDTAHFFAASASYRVRPAYDEPALGRVLRSGITPDGATLHALMPRYAIGEVDLADLSAHLRQLSNHLPDGIDTDTVHLASVTTPDADPVRRDAMLATLRRFIEQKNGQSRHELQRAAQSRRTREMAMYGKFRVWAFEHWPLQGEPATWAAQLDAWQARSPVYALLGGVGATQWEPVEQFCERQRLPCLLPLVDTPGAATATGFYNLHFHAGIEFDAALAASALKRQGVGSYALRAEAADPALADRVRAAFTRAGLRETAQAGTAPAAWVSLLAPAAHTAWLRSSTPVAPVVWLAGTHALGRAELDAALPLTARGLIVSPLQTGERLDRQLARTRAWLRAHGLEALPPDVAASTLQAATVLGEGLAHADFNFTQEYLLELLEHSLENVVPWSPYPRLGIGPGQRIASKGSWVGEIRQGQLDWQWRVTP